MVRIEDIAERLNVSKGTVSKALNGAADVSETLRKLIIETAVELGYTRIKRANNAPRIIIFVMNMECNQPGDFGYDIVMGFRKMAVPAGFDVIIEPLSKSLQKSTYYDAYMMEHQYAGAFFLGLSLSDEWLSQLQTSRTPAVLLDNQVKANPNTAYVGIDNQEGIDLAIEYLKACGHKNIGYLSGTLGSYINQARHTAFFHSLRKNGLRDNPSLSGSSYHFAECIQTHLPLLLQQDVTAILCNHDLLAHSVMLHCQELGLRVPEDISIIGFDDLPLCAYTQPPLTTIRQNRTEIGKSAFYALNSLINEVPISTLLLHASFIKRQSAGPAPQTSPSYRLQQF